MELLFEIFASAVIFWGLIQLFGGFRRRERTKNGKPLSDDPSNPAPSL